MRFVALVLSAVLVNAVLSQEQTASTQTAPLGSSVTITIPAGTKVPLVLKHALTTKSARVGDGVYLQTSFPVTVNDTIVIPPGTYVQGAIDQIKRAGRIKGRAEVLFHFTTLIFPSGYTVSIPGSIESVPGMETSKVKEKEGTLQSEGQKGQDTATVAGTSATGAVVGALSRGAKGAGIGAGIGAAAGLATVLFTRGNDIRLEPGTTVEMVFNRALQLDAAKLNGTNSNPVEAQREPRERRPVLVQAPDQR
jgi:type IV secretion system protein VirB10